MCPRRLLLNPKSKLDLKGYENHTRDAQAVADTMDGFEKEIKKKQNCS